MDNAKNNNDNKTQAEDVARTVRFKLRKHSSATAVKKPTSPVIKADPVYSTSGDGNEKKEDVTKTVRLKLKRPLSGAAVKITTPLVIKPEPVSSPPGDGNEKKEDVTKTVRLKLKRPSSGEAVKITTPPVIKVESTSLSIEDDKAKADDVTKNLKPNLSKASSTVGAEKKELEVNQKTTSSPLGKNSKRLPKKSIVLKRRQNGPMHQYSIIPKLQSSKTFDETKKADIENDRVVKKLSLEQKNKPITSDDLGVELDTVLNSLSSDSQSLVGKTVKNEAVGDEQKENTLINKKVEVATSEKKFKPMKNSLESSGNNVTKTQSLKLRFPNLQSKKAVEITKTQTLKLRVPMPQPPGLGEITKTQTLKLRTPKIQNLSSDEVTKTQTLKLRNPKLPPITSSPISIKQEAGISNEISNDLEDALDALSFDNVSLDGDLNSVKNDEGIGEELKKEESTLNSALDLSNELSLDKEAVLENSDLNIIESEDAKSSLHKTTPSIEKISEVSNTLNESQEKQHEYGFAFVLVALLTLVGLIGVVYISFLSLSFFS